MKSGCLQLLPRISEQTRCLERNGQVATVEQPVDVVHPEPNPFHVERLDGPSEGSTLFDQGCQSIAGVGLRRQEFQERQHPCLGGESVIGGWHQQRPEACLAYPRVAGESTALRHPGSVRDFACESQLHQVHALDPAAECGR